MSAVSFKVAKHEAAVIRAIARRAQAIRDESMPFHRQGAEMDITAVHANGCPLRLEELLEADDFDFAHDVFGIFRHIDRESGKLLDCFVPRYAQPERKP